jgi:hypothetical protein
MGQQDVCTLLVITPIRREILPALDDQFREAFSREQIKVAVSCLSGGQLLEAAGDVVG